MIHCSRQQQVDFEVILHEEKQSKNEKKKTQTHTLTLVLLTNERSRSPHFTSVIDSIIAVEGTLFFPPPENKMSIRKIYSSRLERSLTDSG
jgi:hypothetical protein